MKKLKRRLQQALTQEARRLQIEIGKVDEVMATIESLVSFCGKQSSSRQMRLRIGSLLLKGQLHIIAPACPDYSHRDGQYTFRDVGGDVSLLAQLQIRFLKTVTKLLPRANVTILIADQEADDEQLCRAIQKPQNTFLELIYQSRLATQQAVAAFGWQVRMMTEAIPNLLAKEVQEIESIRRDSRLQHRIMSDTISRSEMYRKIGRLTNEEMVERTIRTAAQYRVMAKFAATHGFLVCNHSTVNLSWYREARAAVLHNPVTVY